MAETDDRAREEKLAAARKKYEQLKKQKGKKTAGAKGAEKGKVAAADEEESSSAAPAPKDVTGTDVPDVTGKLEAVEGAVEGAGMTETGSAVSPAEQDVAIEDVAGDAVDGVGPAAPHGRQPSLSMQSQRRSSSFRHASLPQGPLSPTAPSTNHGNGKIAHLPPLKPQGETMTDIYRKQAARLELVERDHRRLERELAEKEASQLRTEEELEELRAAKGELTVLRERLQKMKMGEDEVEKLVRIPVDDLPCAGDVERKLTGGVQQRSEMAALQRQNAHLQSQTSKSSRQASIPGPASVGALTDSAELEEALKSRSATIELMELEISNLRAQLHKQSSSSSAHDDQVSALEAKVERSEKAAAGFQRELAELKKNLDRISERAVKEGSQRTSAETKIQTLEREMHEGQQALEAARRKAEHMEQKVSTLTTLHKEYDMRAQARIKERDQFERDAADLRRKLAATEEELRVARDGKDRARTNNDDGEADDDGIDALADDQHHRLQLRVRELETELFDLRRGVWRERRKELDGGADAGPATAQVKDHGGMWSPGANFDEVDLTGNASGPRRSLAAAKAPRFADVLTGGLSALTGGGLGLGSGSGTGLAAAADDDEDAAFDEDAFRQAHEDEAQRRLERVKEVKRSLKQWEGWRLDLVESRAGGGGNGEIFDV
ncbi:MAG: hypothetical protein M1826_006641 [Phylliscum demangeonii]|nr:MAG: hypothetical protein M1826_006641 [Phylliscum demangeonii]